MEKGDEETREKEKQEKKKPEVKDKIVTTKHAIEIDGETIEYVADAGTMVLFEEDEEKGLEQKATMFFVSYRREGFSPEERPITFSFNGGPGSSSVWLHLGVLGPRRVIAEVEEAKPVPPPYKLVDNNHSLLDVSDLVFIDPISTGYSRTIEGEKPDKYHNFKKDIESVGEFIRLYTTRYERWLSPKFLIGESYGTTRAAGLSGYLQDTHGMYFNGILLVSSILNFQTAYFTPGNDLPYVLFLPTYTATAWYHEKLPKELLGDLEGTIEEVRQFAIREYSYALMLGDNLPDEKRDEIKAKLARYTGLSEEYIEYANLRINIYKFVKELLRNQKRTVGRLDSRFVGIDRDATGENVDYDPSYAAIQGPYTATMYDYVRRELKFESDLPYEILKPLYQKWDYGEFKNKFVDVADTLREAMSKNACLKVFVANGYFDLATPFFATEYTISHMGLDPSLRSNISMEYYRAGHMMYLREESLKKLKNDLKNFVLNALQVKNQ